MCMCMGECVLGVIVDMVAGCYSAGMVAMWVGMCEYLDVFYVSMYISVLLSRLCCKVCCFSFHVICFTHLPPPPAAYRPVRSSRAGGGQYSHARRYYIENSYVNTGEIPPHTRTSQLHETLSGGRSISQPLRSQDQHGQEGSPPSWTNSNRPSPSSPLESSPIIKLYNVSWQAVS